MLTSASVAATYMGLGTLSAAQEAQLTALANAADAAIKRYIGYDIEETTYPGAATNGKGDSGYYSGDGTRFLIARQVPVQSITSIYEDPSGRFGENPDGSFAAATLLVEGTDYVLHTDGCLPGSSTVCSYTGIIERIGGVWPGLWVRTVGEIVPHHRSHRGNIKIAYVGGYDTVPADIEAAANQLVAWMRTTAERGMAVASENLGAYSYTLASQGLKQIGGIEDILNRYRAARKRIA